MKYKTSLIFLFVSIQTIIAQIPIHKYRIEINNLKTQEDSDQYWEKLKDIDQNILVKTENTFLADSISIDLMIRTALMFQIQGDSCYDKFNNSLPILNLSHSHSGKCQLIYWPIIEKCAQIGGVIETMGGKYPAYELECVSLDFYNYSLFKQDHRYNSLLLRLHSSENDSIIDRLNEYFNQLKKLKDLQLNQVLGSWYNQPFKNMKEESVFELVVMSDNKVYLKRSGRLQRLIELDPKNKFRVFKIEDEPFGWRYYFGKDGSLQLLDDKNEELISYTSVKESQPIFDSKVYSTCVNRIESIDPQDSEFSDLQFLKEKLQNKQIIILGESGHGDGATFEAKTRLVKYLSTEMDFKAIAFEGGGFFEMHYANQKKVNPDELVKELKKSWYDIWSGSVQVKELLKYLSENREKIHTFGIENQAGNTYWTEFPSIVKELVGEIAFDGVNYESFNSNFYNFYGAMYIDSTYKADIPQLQLDLSQIRQNLATTNNLHSPTLVQGVLNIEGFIQQMKLNFGTYAEQNQSISLRDSLMTENVLWWIRNNPDQKLIIWTANFHAVNNLHQTIYAEGDDFYQIMKPMGERLKSELGDKVYSVAFTSSEGYSANIYESEATALIVPPDSWESELSMQLIFDYAFIDLGEIKALKKYRNYSFKSLLLGYRNRKGVWLNMFDAVFYIRRMLRSDPRH